MQPLLAEILKHPSDLLAIANPDDLKIIMCNANLESFLGTGKSGFTGTTIYDLLGKKVPREKLRSIIERLKSTNFYLDSDFQIFFHFIKCEDENCCLIRLNNQNVKSEDDKVTIAFEKNLAGVFRTTKEGVILSCNTAMARIFGKNDPSTLTGKNIKEFYENPDTRKELMVQLEDKGVLTNYEMIIRREDGSRAYCLGNSYLEKIPELGEFISGTIIDVTEKREMELALQDSEQRYKAIAAVTDEGVLFAKDNTIIDFNEQFAKMIGFGGSIDLLGTELGDFFSATDLMRIKANVEISPVNKTEVRITSKDGRSTFLEISGSYLPYRGSMVMALVSSDVTARKKVELVLHQGALRFRHLLENSPGGVVIITDGKFAYLNNAACELFGVSDEDELYGEDFIDFIPQEIADDIQKDLNDIRDGFQIDYKETRLRKLDGSTVDVGIKSTLTVYESKPAIQITLNNVTAKNQLIQEQIRVRFIEEINSALKAEIKEHKATQEKLEKQQREAAEQKAKLESIFNSTENLMMWTINREYVITGMNKNFVNWMSSFFNEKVVIGDNIMSVLQQHLDRDFYQGQLDAFANGFKGRPQQFEFALRNKEEHTMWLQAFINPVNMEGHLEELSCLLYDNTERKEMDRRVRDSLKEKEVLLQEVHHRVKNNLQVISSILSLQSSYVDDPRTLEVLRESQQRIKSMSFIHETIYRTADFSKLEFTDYVRTIVSNLVQSYRSGNESVQLISEMDEVVLNLDQSIPCGLIINELVSNSLKYAFKKKGKGKLTVGLHQKGEEIILLVKDDGVGLPKDFGYEKTNSLGIQLVYALLEQLDATMEISNKKGAEFLITFHRK